MEADGESQRHFLAACASLEACERALDDEGVDTTRYLRLTHAVGRHEVWRHGDTGRVDYVARRVSVKG